MCHGNRVWSIDSSCLGLVHTLTCLVQKLHTLKKTVFLTARPCRLRQNECKPKSRAFLDKHGDDAEAADRGLYDALDANEILTVAMLPINSRLRNTVVAALRRDKSRQRDAARLKDAAREDELVPVGGARRGEVQNHHLHDEGRVGTATQLTLTTSSAVASGDARASGANSFRRPIPGCAFADATRRRSCPLCDPSSCGNRIGSPTFRLHFCVPRCPRPPKAHRVRPRPIRTPPRTTTRFAYGSVTLRRHPPCFGS